MIENVEQLKSNLVYALNELEQIVSDKKDMNKSYSDTIKIKKAAIKDLLEQINQAKKQ